MIIGIKIGSNLLTDGLGHINDKLILEVCRQVAYLLEEGHKVFIVSSGAVASDPKKNRSKNLRAGVGQIRLMNRYQNFFDIFEIEISQHLLTDRDLTKKNNVISRRTLLEAMKEKVVPIINGNDVVDDKELKALEISADNDRLFQSICLLVKADAAIIGFGEKGLMDNKNQVIHQVKISNTNEVLKYARRGSKLGHGKNGMKTKILVLKELAEKKIISILAPGKEKDFILRAFSGEKKFGTKFII